MPFSDISLSLSLQGIILGGGEELLIFEKYKESRPTPIGTQVEPQFTSKKQSGSASAGSGLGWRPTSLDEGPELTRIRHSSTHPSVFSRPVWCYP